VPDTLGSAGEQGLWYSRIDTIHRQNNAMHMYAANTPTASTASHAALAKNATPTPSTSCGCSRQPQWGLYTDVSIYSAPRTGLQMLSAAQQPLNAHPAVLHCHTVLAGRPHKSMYAPQGQACH
jgi:hypothetical protein